jgi:hypothetical protein
MVDAPVAEEESSSWTHAERRVTSEVNCGELATALGGRSEMALWLARCKSPTTS